MHKKWRLKIDASRQWHGPTPHPPITDRDMFLHQVSLTCVEPGGLLLGLGKTKSTQWSCKIKPGTAE